MMFYVHHWWILIHLCCNHRHHRRHHHHHHHHDHPWLSSSSSSPSSSLSSLWAAALSSWSLIMNHASSWRLPFSQIMKSCISSVLVITFVTNEDSINPAVMCCYKSQHTKSSGHIGPSTIHGYTLSHMCYRQASAHAWSYSLHLRRPNSSPCLAPRGEAEIWTGFGSSCNSGRFSLLRFMWLISFRREHFQVLCWSSCSS